MASAEFAWSSCFCELACHLLLRAMPRRVSGALVLPLRGRVEATSGPSCPTPVRQAPSYGFACLRRCCHSRVLSRRAVVPTVSSSARLLQGRGLLARVSAGLGAPSVPPQLPVLGCSALPISSSTGATTACGAGSLVSGMIQPSGTRCTTESVCRSIHEPLLPNLTSAPLCVSFPNTEKRPF